MKINTKVKYGLKALVYIVEESSKDRLVRIKEISEKENISIQYLEQILNKLKKENIIEGKRGPSGGYKFSLNADEITLYKIYKILDEDDKVINCNEIPKETKVCFDASCGSDCIWHKLDNAMKEILESVNLGDLLKNKNMI